MNKILVILFFLSSLITAQRNSVFPQNSVLGDSVKSHTYTLNQSVTDSMQLFLLSGYMPIKIDTTFSTSNITLQPNQEQFSNANRWFTNLGDWDTTGNMGASWNSDSSITANNIPTELNPNPNFEDWNYVDVLSGWNLSDWSLLNSSVVDDNNTFRTTSEDNGGIYKTGLLTTNNVYAITLNTTIRGGGTTSLYQTAVANGNFNGNVSNGILYFTYNGIVIRGTTTYDTIDVNTLSAKKLIAPTGLTSATMNASNYVLENANGIQFKEATETISISLSGLTNGQTYRIINNLYSRASGELNVFNGSTETAFSTSLGLDTVFVTMVGTTITFQVDNNSDLVSSYISITEVHDTNEFTLANIVTDNVKFYELNIDAKSDSTSRKLYYSYGSVLDSLSLTATYQTITKEFLGQGADTLKFWATENTEFELKNISLEEITSKIIVQKDSTEKIYFTPSTSSVGAKSGTITINNNKIVTVNWIVEYPDSLLAFDSTSFNFGTIVEENTKDLIIKVRNVSQTDTIDFHAWLNLLSPFEIETFNQGWYVAPNDSGSFTIRVTHLGVDTTVTQNIGWVYSDIEDNFRDTVFTEFTVVMQVNSNTLLAAQNLDAVSSTNGIMLNWQDDNIADTTVVYDLDFLTSADVDSFTASSSAAILSYDVGKMKVTNNSASSSWNSAKIEIPVISGQRYETTVDYIDGTANSGWLVIYDKLVPATKLTNQSSTTDTTFTYSFVSTFTGTAVIQLQINSSGLGSYGHFDNFLVEQTEPSYDYLAVERQPYYLNYPNGDFATLYTNYDAITSYLDTDVEIGEQFNYRVKYYKNPYTVYSNSDTATRILDEEEIIVDMHDIYADAYVKNGGSTTWADRTDSSTGITIETLLSNIATLGTNKIVAFKSGQYFLKAFKLNGSAYDGITLTTYGGSARATIGLYDTLPGWSITANWVSQGAKDDGYIWKYDFSGEFMEDYALQRLWLNGVEYYPRANLEKLRVLNTYHTSLGVEVTSSGGQAPELIQDSVWAKFSATYPWTRDVNHNNSAEELIVWTPTNTNPASYYTSMHQVSANSADADWSGVVEFQDIDNLTLDYLNFEGGEFKTVFFIKCDSGIVRNCLFKKPQYGSVIALQSSDFEYINNEFWGYEDLPDATIVYDETGAREGLTIDYDSDNNIVRGNKIYNYSTQGARVSASTSLYQTNNGYGSGIPENNIIDSNYIANTIGRRYARPFQVHANELTDTSNSTLNDNTRQPVNTTITRNVIKGMNVGAKDIGNGITFMYNVYEGQNTTLPTWIIDHNGIMASNNSYVFETLGDTTHALRLYANNTFLNVQSGISYSGSDLGFTTANIAYENNLFLNMARSRKFNIRTFTPNIYINSDVDFKWYRNRVALSVQNNLSYNSNLTDTGDRITYKIDDDPANIFTYAEFATYLTGDANRVVSGNIPLSNASYNLNSILPNWQNGDYSVSASNQAYNGGKSISSYIPSWLTKDYFGNTINTTTPNIGAVDNN